MLLKLLSCLSRTGSEAVLQVFEVVPVALTAAVDEPFAVAGFSVVKEAPLKSSTRPFLGKIVKKDSFKLGKFG